MTKNQKRNIRKEVTDKILAALKTGVAPWVTPWNPVGGVNVNVKTGKSYRGINVWLLNLARLDFGYTSNEWLTYKQAKSLSTEDNTVSVRKGERGHPIVFWQIINKTDGAGNESSYPLMRHYTVFNRDQVEGLPEVEVEDVPQHERHAKAEATIDAYGADIVYGGDKAFYNRTTDQVTVPELVTFHNPESFYSTVFHELVHQTGAPNRLNREKGKAFGDTLYAKEELVAELGAAFLCAEHEISGELQHEGYIASWIRALENDTNFIFSASSKAQKAADYITDPKARRDAAKAA